jgi:hypothetical protein
MRGLTRMHLLYRNITKDQKRAGQAPQLHFLLNVVTWGIAPLMLIFVGNTNRTQGTGMLNEWKSNRAA